MDLSLGINSRKCHTIFFKTLEIKRIFQEVLQNAVFSISFYARSFLTNFSGISSMSISAFSNISSKKINKCFDAPLHRNFSLKDFVRKCDQTQSSRIWPHLLKKPCYIYWRNPSCFVLMHRLTHFVIMFPFFQCFNFFMVEVPIIWNQSKSVLYRANQWTSFHMIGTSVMKELRVHPFIAYAKPFNN